MDEGSQPVELEITDRPLSPVLNNSSLFRKRLFERKRSSKTRVQLAKRFSEHEDEKNKYDTDFEFKKPVSPVCPAKKIKSSVPSFCTASGKNIAISSEALKKQTEIFKDIFQTDLNENNPIVFKKDFSAQRLLSTASTTPCKQVEVDNFQTCLGDTQILLDAEAAVCLLNFTTTQDSAEDECLNNRISVCESTNSANFLGFSVKECQFSDRLLQELTKKFNEYCGKSEPILCAGQMADAEHNNSVEFPFLDNSLCKVFAYEDLSLIASVSNQKNDSGELKDPESFIKTTLEYSTGFSTANERPILISHKAREKTKGLFVDELPQYKVESGRCTNENDQNKECKSTSLLNILEHKELFDDLHCRIDNEEGFFTASSKNIKVSESTCTSSLGEFEKTHFSNPTERDFMTEPNQLLFNSAGFSTANGKSIQISKDALSKSKKLFADDGFITENINHQNKERNSLSRKRNSSFKDSTLVNTGFSTTGGKKINISNAALTKSTENINKNDLREKSISSFKNPALVNTGFSTAGGKNIDISNEALTKSKKLFTDDDFNAANINGQDKIAKLKGTALVNTGFSTAAGKNIEISNEATRKTQNLFVDDFTIENINNQYKIQNFQPDLVNFKGPPLVNNGFSTAAGKKIEVSGGALIKSKNLFADDFTTDNVNDQDQIQNPLPGNDTTKFKDIGRKIETTTENSDLGLRGEDLSKSFVPLSSKKRLGMSSCKQSHISNESLDKAKMFFKELDVSSVPTTPVRSNIYSSTPLKQNVSLTKQVHKPSFLNDLDITPVKRLRIESKTERSAIVMQKKTDGDTHTWIKNMQDEYNSLQKRLQIILERQAVLEEQQKFLNSQNSARRRQVLGVLSEKRQFSQRITLRQLLGTRRPGHAFEEIQLRESHLWNITPQNAVNVHINCSWNNESPAVKYTKDGAVIIPTLDNLVGLSEIKAAFEAMLGVDPKLIPRGWIDNHFKWIVWKLASYERNFPDVFAETLTIENIIQQLKYRYDREIDKAERSALRKILETDDVPQKRMVLCVSDIVEVGSLLEIELTDGWYSVRTTIDDLLRQQINLSKIVVGTKLITQWADILNCDGCHPLEVPDNVRLKINFNCTRRAAWDSKLGYQKVTKPFPLSLDSFHFMGGIVGCVKIYVARVYPLRYLEKFDNGKRVWRNAKAEEKRAREWENKNTEELETVQEKVRKEYEKELKLQQANKVSYGNLGEDTSSEALYKMLEASDDPDGFKEKLTSTQFKSIVDYHQNISNQQNSEISIRISKELEKLNKTEREVYPVLKLLVVDRLRDGDQTHVLNIWKPSEEHLQELKEGFNFLIYNIVLKSNGDFASTNKTYFKSEPITADVKKCPRRVVSILDLQKSTSTPLYKEFDTVGTVVQISKFESYQEAWITDCVGNLLHVKVFEGASMCCLFDNMSRGQNVAFMNVTFCEPKPDFGRCIANQFSVVTRFPRQKFLQDALTKYSQQLPKDQTFLDDCDIKIKKLLVTKGHGLGSSVSASTLSVLVDSGSVVDDSLEDNTLISSHLTATDIAMLLIDTDQYFENMLI